MQPYTRRYFDEYISLPSSSDHTYFNLHTNKLIMIGIQASHPIIQSEHKISRVEILMGLKKGQENVDLGKRDSEEVFEEKKTETIEEKKNTEEPDIYQKSNWLRDYTKLVKGKKKKGGIRITPGCPMFKFVMANGEEYTINSLIQGSVIGGNRVFLI